MTEFISIQADVRAATRYLTAAASKQVPFAIAKALTALAFDVQRAEQAEMFHAFRNPRPFSLRSVVVDKATKGLPVATVRIKDQSAPYLAPFVFGGPHFVPGRGLVTIMPVGLTLDQYGQIRGRPRAIGDKPNTFVGTITFKASGKTVSGFWQRPPLGTRQDGSKGTKGNTQRRIGGARTGLKLLAEFEQTPLQAKVSFDFIGRAQAVVLAGTAARFKQELGKAIASAKA